MSIKVENITKLYGSQKALNDVSFELGKGELVGFLGPNGAGKSTMMKILTGFVPQTSGVATVCGFDVLEHPLKVKQKVGYLPEHNPLYLEMYVKEFLLFVAGLHKVPKAKPKVMEIIERVGLDPEMHKQIGSLSKGYRQRVGLAQAMLHDPEVLILDEPTTGLDPNQIIEIRSLIQSLGKEKTVMMSTHIMQEVEAICDRVLIIREGELVADQSAGSIKNMGSAESVIVVEFDREIEADALKKLDNVNRIESIGDNRWKITSDAKTDLRPEIFNLAVEQKWAVLSMQREEQRLEDVFKSLTTQGQ